MMSQRRAVATAILLGCMFLMMTGVSSTDRSGAAAASSRAAADMSSAVPPGFGQACEMMIEVPYGTDVATIEAMLGLNPAGRTVRRVVKYKGEILNYQRLDGLRVELGVTAVPKSREHPEGGYTYNGHHSIIYKNKVWHHWQFADGTGLYRFGLLDPRGH